jgi:flagellar protein FlaJ
MKSSKSSPKRTGKNSSEQVTGFDLFYQLTSMSATSAAGIPRGKIFELACKVPAAPARFFERIVSLSDKMRLNYPDSCRMVGMHIKSEQLRTFLLRFADALKSGEPLVPFLAREAEVQGSNYSNEYERQLESLKKWNDGYTSIAVSAALIVVINMVSTMIYNVGPVVMLAMIATAVVVDFIVAWVLSRAAPPEIMSVPWSKGSFEQQRAVLALKICGAAAVVVGAGTALLHAPIGWILIACSLAVLPAGVTGMIAESKVAKRDAEVGAFFRSVGGTATSRGTTLGEALSRIQIDSFPSLESNIRKLLLRLRAAARPELCWHMFGTETGSRLISQATGVFFEATNLGGDPETAGVLCSLFSTRTAMLRAKRSGVAATFSWLMLVMHGVVSALMVFILEILKKFMELMQSAVPAEAQEEAIKALSLRLVSFAAPQTDFLTKITIAMLILLAVVNGYAIVASEGTHLVKVSLYLSIMLLLTGISFLVVPSLVASLM